MKYCILFALFCIAFAQVTDSDGITELDNNSFHTFISQHQNIFMFFHSKWDSRSRGFEYEFRQIARRAKKEGIPVEFAKINLPANRDIAQIYRTHSYPALHLFKDGDNEYYHDRQTENDIIFFLRKRLLSKIVRITSTSDIKTYRQFNRPTVVCHFKNDKMLKYKYFSEAVDNLNDVQVLCGFGEDDVGEPMDTFTVYTPDKMASTYNGKWEVDALKEFITIRSAPRIVPYESRWNHFLYSSNHNIKHHLVFMSVDEDLDTIPDLRHTLETFAAKLQGKLFVVHMHPEANNMMDTLGFDYEHLPILFFLDMTESVWKKYIFHGDYNLEEITQFYEDVMENRLYPYYKSEPVYKRLDGFVKVLVGKDFEDVAFDPYTNVLVEFVVPGCRACDRVEEDYQRLAEAYINTDDVVIARIDMSKNDIPNLSIGQYPTFILYQAGGDGEKSIPFHGDQTDYTRLKKFVEKAKTIAPKRPTALPEKVQEEKEKVPEEEVEMELVYDEAGHIIKKIKPTVVAEEKVEEKKVEKEQQETVEEEVAEQPVVEKQETIEEEL